MKLREAVNHSLKWVFFPWQDSFQKWNACRRSFHITCWWLKFAKLRLPSSPSSQKMNFVCTVSILFHLFRMLSDCDSNTWPLQGADFFVYTYTHCVFLIALYARCNGASCPALIFDAPASFVLSQNFGKCRLEVGGVTTLGHTGTDVEYWKLCFFETWWRPSQ